MPIPILRRILFSNTLGIILKLFKFSPLILGFLSKYIAWYYTFSGLFIIILLDLAFEKLIFEKIHTIDILLKLVYEKIGAKPEEKIRCAFLIPVNNKIIKKISSYDGKIDHNLKKISARSGTAGRAFSTKKEIILAELIGDFKEVMIKDWGFLENEIPGLRQDRKSYISIPFISEKRNEVIGIICVDSCKPNFCDVNRFNEIQWFVSQFCKILSPE